MHLTPAGLPPGIPGTAEEIDVAIQQAPHSGRHSMNYNLEFKVGKNTKILLIRILYSVIGNR
jgi:hypothetical protein